ncbi:hypothetical protein MASR2M78_06370 [Treponema sp.]
MNETPTPKSCTYFNFLASHDGVGLRPTEGILNDRERLNIADACLERGGFVNYRHGENGAKLPYELNINYMDALSPSGETDDKRLARMLGAHALLFSMPGIPAVYVHSLLGSRNWREGAIESGINRRINRKKMDFDRLSAELEVQPSLRRSVLDGLRRLAAARSSCPALEPEAELRVLGRDTHLISYERVNTQSPSENGSHLLVIVNLIDEVLSWKLDYSAKDLIGGKSYEKGEIQIEGLQALYLQKS